MADEITKIQVTIRRFLYEVRGVRHEDSEAGKWLDRFCTTLEFQDLDPKPEAYAASLIDEARKYSEVKRYAARVRIAKAELIKEGTKRPTRQQIEERLKEIYAEEEITAAAATREGADVEYNRESGTFARTTGCNHYDQETAKTTISTNSPAGAGANLDSTQPISPDASSGNAEVVTTNGSPITRNGSRAAFTSATSGQTFEAPLRPGAGEVPPENVSAKPSPALPVPSKKAHGEFGNVMLTDDEYAKLCEKCADADALITELDQYIESQGKTKKYKRHYATLLNWSRRKAQEAKQKNGYKTAAEKDADVLKELAEYYDNMEAV